MSIDPSTYQLDQWEWLIILLGAFIVGISKSGIKGIGIIIVTLMALVFGGKASTGIVLILFCFGDVMAVLYYKRHAQWKYLIQFMPWMIVGVVLGAFVGKDLPEDVFKKGIQNYLKKYQFRNVTITDFLNEMETVSGKDLTYFHEEWLESTSFPYKKTREILDDNCSSIKLLTEMEEELKNAQSDDIDYPKYWDITNSVHLKKYLLENYGRTMLFDGLRKAFESDTIPIRQAIFKSVPFNAFLPKEYLLGLLEDNSYHTQEMALLQLWQGYPEDRLKYLDIIKGIIGLPNKNVRLLWLTLAIITTEYEHGYTQDYVKELMGYTSPIHSWEIRMGAFQYLHETLGLNETGLRNLFEATTHHSWQFKKYARSLIDELLKDSDYLIRIRKISKELNEEELRYLKTKMEIE